jgi:hypothetical protein
MNEETRQPAQSPAEPKPPPGLIPPELYPIFLAVWEGDGVS